MNMKLKTLGLLTLALSATALAAFDGLSVMRKPKEGEQIRYRMTADVDFGGMAIKAKFLVAEKVTKVEADGSYKLEQQQLEGVVDLNGQEQEMPSSGPTVTVYTKEGEIKEISGAETTPDSYRLANLGLMRDPGKTLNVGDTWTHEIKADAKTGAVAAKAEYKVLAEEKVGDWDTVKVSQTIKETEGTDPASSTGTVWLLKEDGSTVKAESKWVNAPFPGAPGPINATVKMEREK
jgi:hypothetical protein